MKPLRNRAAGQESSSEVPRCIDCSTAGRQGNVACGVRARGRFGVWCCGLVTACGGAGCGTTPRFPPTARHLDLDLGSCFVSDSGAMSATGLPHTRALLHYLFTTYARPSPRPPNSTLSSSSSRQAPSTEGSPELSLKTLSIEGSSSSGSRNGESEDEGAISEASSSATNSRTIINQK